MAEFQGFTDQETFAQIPDAFFHKLLKEIDDGDELKVTLYAIWRMAHMEGHVRFLRTEDFSEIVPDPRPALEKAVRRGSLIGVEKGEMLFFLNSPRGRAAAKSYAKGQWQPGAEPSAPPRERPQPRRRLRVHERFRDDPDGRQADDQPHADDLWNDRSPHASSLLPARKKRTVPSGD